jgi:hypothetical protein
MTRPNRELTTLELQEKQVRKARLKEQKHQKYWEGRVIKAKKYKDPEKEQHAREQLGLLGVGEYDISGTVDPVVYKGKAMIQTVYRQLQAHDPSVGKEREYTCLLKHMRKNTQEKSMFANADALWGYTRSKFCDRAGEIVTSLAKLNEQDEPWRDRFAAIRKACAFGSGPGSDAVGLVSFLQSYFSEEFHLDHMVLFDFCDQEWREVTDPLCITLSPKDIRQMDACFCDVTKPLQSTENEAVVKECGEMDFYIISYLLTETHGHWDMFIAETIHLAKPGALFYFAEPRPWQLQHLIRLCASQLSFTWLDSSMDHPALQGLGARVGPAVLLGIKEEHCSGDNLSNGS